MIKFDVNGNLPEDIVLKFVEVEKYFGYNLKRKRLIQNLFETAKKFAEIGCKVMYVNGSFVTSKKTPGDIDVAFDISEVDYLPAKAKYPDLFSDEGQSELKKTHGLDAFTFGSYNDDILYVFGKDRKGNKKGIVKIFLKELMHYDKK